MKGIIGFPFLGLADLFLVETERLSVSEQLPPDVYEGTSLHTSIHAKEFILNNFCYHH